MQALILSTGMLPSGSAVLLCRRNAKMFLLPLHVHHWEHRNGNKGSESVTHIKGVIRKQYYM